MQWGSHRWPMTLTFCHFLLLAWIFESLPIFTKLLETLQKSQNQSPLMKKRTLGYQRHILVLLHSLEDFSYIAFRSFICGIFCHLASDHIASKWFEIFHDSINHSLLMRKPSLANWWHSIERLQEFTYGTNILPPCFTGHITIWHIFKNIKLQ